MRVGHRNRCECGKRQYRDKQQARRIAAEYRRVHNDDRMQAYKCPFERRLWHLGHANPEHGAGGGVSRLVQRRLIRWRKGIPDPEAPSDEVAV